jgi:drug/metabolite transporter (DMT)-like permease
MTLILAWLLLGETPKPIHAAALGIALAGLYFLSHNDPPGQVQSSGARTLGNILIVLSFIGEGAYSPCSKKLVQKYPAAPLFGSALLIGWLLQTLTVGVLSGLPSPSQFSLKSGFAVLYLGILGTTATYLYWMKSILQAPLAVLVLTLFLQPIAGALWSGLILGETLTAIQWLGGGLILLSMGLEPAFDYFGRPTASPRI